MDKIIKALGEYGNTGVEGKMHNVQVTKYFEELGFTDIHDDETPWCAAFANWILRACNIKGTGSLAARSFLKLGVDTKQPRLGDLVVLWRIRPDSPYGHVGFFIKESDKLVWILGGNQNNSVNIMAYSKVQLLGYRKV